MGCCGESGASGLLESLKFWSLGFLSWIPVLCFTQARSRLLLTAVGAFFPGHFVLINYTLDVEAVSPSCTVSSAVWPNCVSS
jgi:hypothetical protein